MSAISYRDLPNNTLPQWWKDPGMRKGMIHIFILYSAVYSLGYDGSLLNGLQALPAWQSQFNYPRGTTLGLIAATYYLPKIPTTFVVAWMVDKYGRKIPLYIGSVFMLAGAIFGGLCHTPAELMGARVLLGIGTAYAQITACAMIPELAHPRLRYAAGGFLNTTYFPGASDWSWRIPTLVQGLGPIILCIGVYFVPQSPRWLVKQGRVEEAHDILATYHANGDHDDPLVLLEMREIQNNVTLDEKTKSGGWASFFNSTGNRSRFFVIILIGTATQWLGNGLVSYFLVPILTQVGVTQPGQTAGINGGIAIWSWLAAMTGASLADRFGRRSLFLTSLVGCLVSFILITALSGSYASSGNSATGLAMIPFLFLFNSAYALAFTPIPMLYVPEISPMALRAKSAALLLLSQNCAQAFNQFVNPVALAAIAWKYFIVYVAVISIYIVLFYFFVKETRRLTVEEAAVVYDPDHVRDALLREERMIRELAAAEEKEGKEKIIHEESKVQH